MIFLESWVYVDILVRVDHSDVLIVERLKIQLSMFGWSVSYNSQRQLFGYLKQVLPEALNAFLLWTLLITFCLGEMKGALVHCVNDKCNW